MRGASVARQRERHDAGVARREGGLAVAEVEVQTDVRHLGGERQVGLGDRHVELPEQAQQVRVGVFVPHQESGVHAVSETPSGVMSTVRGWPPNWLLASNGVPRGLAGQRVRDRQPGNSRPDDRAASPSQRTEGRTARPSVWRRVSRSAPGGIREGGGRRSAARGLQPNRIGGFATKKEVPCTARHAEYCRANKLEDAGCSEFPSGEGKEMRLVGGIVTGHGSREVTGWRQTQPNCPIHPGGAVLEASTCPCWYWGQHPARAWPNSRRGCGIWHFADHPAPGLAWHRPERVGEEGAHGRAPVGVQGQRAGPALWRDTLWATSGWANSEHSRGVGR